MTKEIEVDSDLYLTPEVLALTKDRAIRAAVEKYVYVALSEVVDSLRGRAPFQLGEDIPVDPRLTLEDTCRLVCILIAEPLDASAMYRRLMPHCQGDDGRMGHNAPAEHFRPVLSK